MTWLLRLAALVAAFFLLRWLFLWLWRRGWKYLLSAALGRAATPAPPPARHGTLKRDPICGLHVDAEVAVTDRAGNETLYFCSERCRQAYRQQQRQEIKKTG